MTSHHDSHSEISYSLLSYAAGTALSRLLSSQTALSLSRVAVIISRGKLAIGCQLGVELCLQLPRLFRQNTTIYLSNADNPPEETSESAKLESRLQRQGQRRRTRGTHLSSQVFPCPTVSRACRAFRR